MQVLDFYNQNIEARNRMLELILPGKVVFLRPRKVTARLLIHHLPNGSLKCLLQLSPYNTFTHTVVHYMAVTQKQFLVR